MNIRKQIVLDEETQRRAEARAAELGVSFPDYMLRLLADDLAQQDVKPRTASPGKPDVSIFFDLITDGPPTDIARDKDAMIGEAVWDEHLRSIGRKQTRARR